jgi:predicted DCC family thiol-disulfide oxidoreductase YuxK
MDQGAVEQSSITERELAEGQTAGRGSAAAAGATPILFYDARCSVCRRFVAMAVRADRKGLLRLAPLVGARAEEMRRVEGRFQERDSAVWLSGEGAAVNYSDAILGVLHYLGGGWRMLAWLGRLVPRPIRNAMYRWFAGHRNYFGWMGLAELDAATRRRLLIDETERQSNDVAAH